MICCRPTAKRNSFARPEHRYERRTARQSCANPGVAGNQVEKTYSNGTHALQRLKLSVGRGEFVSLLGPSGCGKSTLLKMFAGLEQPSAGHVRWWGKGDIRQAEAEQKMAMVFQEATLMPWATIAANVGLPLELTGVPKAERARRVQAALNRVGLGEFAQAWPRELSGGMQMRASIARALALNPICC